ncbi:hypothetical protein [Streptomyces chartreusis]
MQLQHEDARWIRDQRQAAYHAMLTASPKCVGAALDLEGTGTGEPRLPPEFEAVRKAVSEASYTALSQAELCGPMSVVTAARELHKHSTRLVTVRAHVHHDTSGIHLATTLNGSARRYRTSGRPPAPSLDTT